MKAKGIILVLLFICGTFALSAATAGDYRSNGTGIWSNLATWKVYNGAVWNDATAIPSSTTDVYIQTGHTVTLTAHSSCNSLSIAKGNASANNSNGKLALAAYDLNLNGNLRVFWASMGTIPGVTSTVTNMLITSTGGDLRVVGSTRSLLMGTWDGTFTSTTSLFPIVFDPGAGVTISIGSTLRAQSWTIASGTVDMAATAFIHVDNGTNNQGDVTVDSGALLILNGSGSAEAKNLITRSSTKKGGTLTVDGTLRFTGTAPYLAMSAFVLDGTVEYSGINQAMANISIVGSAIMNSYAKLVFSGSGTVVLPYAIYTDGDIVVGPNVTLSLGSYSLSLDYFSTFTKSVTNSGNIFMDLPSLDIDSHTFNTDVTVGYFTSSVTLFTKFSWKPAEVALVGAGETFNIGGASMSSKTVTIRHSLGFIPMNAYWRMKNANDVWGSWYELSTGLDVTFAQFTLPLEAENEIQVVFPETEDSMVQTLPIELSSFTAAPTAEYFVKLRWITQSETNVTGYHILRNYINDLSSAQIISLMMDATNTTSETTYTFVDNDVSPGVWYYWLKINEFDGSFEYNGPVVINLVRNPDDPAIPDIPIVQGIRGIFPNPFNPSTTVSYSLPESRVVQIDIYNIRGEHVRNLYSGIARSGMNWVAWDGKTDNGQNCTSGVYYTRLKAGSIDQVRKMMMLK